MLVRDRNLFLLICVANLILASFIFLAMLMGEAGCHSALSSSPPHPHGPVTIREILMDSIVTFWFAGALGLFSRKPLAWIGSLVGTGASACFFAVSLVVTAGLYIFPTENMERLRDLGGTGYIAALIIGGGVFCGLLAVSLGLFIGLFRMRKELR